MTLMSYIEALLDQWQRGIRDPEDVVREIRKAAAEEREIEEATRMQPTVIFWPVGEIPWSVGPFENAQAAEAYRAEYLRNASYPSDDEIVVSHLTRPESQDPGTVAPTEATSATVHLTVELAIPEEIRASGSGEVWAKLQVDELLEAILAIWEVVGNTAGSGFSVGKVGLNSWVKELEEDPEYLRARLDEAVARDDEVDIRRFSDRLKGRPEFAVGKTGGPVLARFGMFSEAEEWIAEQEKVDPEGVRRGDYFIDGPEQMFADGKTLDPESQTTPRCGTCSRCGAEWMVAADGRCDCGGEVT